MDGVLRSRVGLATGVGLLAALALALVSAGAGRADFSLSDGSINTASLAPNGSWFAFYGSTPADIQATLKSTYARSGRIFLVRPDGTGLQQAVRLQGYGGGADQIAWLPDSSGFFFIDHKGGHGTESADLYRYAVASHAIKQIAVKGDLSALAISRDGHTVAALNLDCHTPKDGGDCLLIVDTRTMSRKVVPLPANDPLRTALSFSFSHDGRRLLIPGTVQSRGTGVVFGYTLKSGKIGIVYRQPFSNSSAAYNDVVSAQISPSGGSIVYHLQGDPGDKLRVARFPSNHVQWEIATQQKVDGDGPTGDLAWSPSGALAFRDNGGSNSDPHYQVGIWTSGGGAHLINVEASDGTLNWIDGTHVGWVSLEGVTTLDIATGDATTQPLDKTLAQAAG